MNEELRRELLRMQEQDQDVRELAVDAQQGGTLLTPADKKRAASTDAENRRRMKELLSRHGWPGRSLVGEDGALAAWLLVQHADGDRAFQKRCLELIRAAVAGGEAAGEHLAYLTDRVLAGEGWPQIYGTQFELVGGRCAPREIADIENVDERRAAVGLGPLAEYLADTERAMTGQAGEESGQSGS